MNSQGCDALSRLYSAIDVETRLDAQTLASVKGKALATVSAEGKDELARVASDGRERLFTMDTTNPLRAHGEKPWSLQRHQSSPPFEAGLRYYAGKLYLVSLPPVIDGHGNALELLLSDCQRARASDGATAGPSFVQAPFSVTPQKPLTL
jgi:hypothetical protein